MDKPNRVESIKNALIVVLFFSTILLLYFFWVNPDTKATEITKAKGLNQSIFGVEDIIRPEQIIINFGNGIYTTMGFSEQDTWDKSLSALKEFLGNENITVEEISEEQYQEIIGFRSIRCEFSYDMPLNSFCKHYNIGALQNVNVIERFSGFAYSSVSKESIFMFNKQKGRYYRLVTKDDADDFEKLIYNISEEEHVNCYPIGTYIGTENNAVMPLTMLSDLSEINYKPEFTQKQAHLIREVAQTFFGESLDFVRKIAESKGSTVYMYGYGQKVLTINVDGSLEYKEKENPAGHRQDYFEALNSAMQFITSHGGWQFLSGYKITPYVLFSTELKREKKKGYRFVFGIEINDEKVYYKSGEPIVVEILEGQITYYKRNIIQINQEELDKLENHTREQVFSAVNMLAKNYRFMHTILSGEGYKFNRQEKDLFEAVSNLISYVKVGNVKTSSETSNGGRLIPAWIIVVDNIMFYFDLYNAEPIGYNNVGIP